jgi:hypothetical protein
MLQLIKNLCLALFGYKFASGYLDLAQGCPSQIFIKTHFTPRWVNLTFRNSAIPPVCIGDVDCFDVTIIPHGFILNVKIRGRARAIGWQAFGHSHWDGSDIET